MTGFGGGRAFAARLRALVVVVALALGAVPLTAVDADAATRPKVTSLSTTSGPVAGGTKVTIYGKYFKKDARVTFGDVAATSVTLVSSKKLVAYAPPSVAGRVYVRVTTTGGTSKAVKDGRFTFVNPPALATISAAQGPTKGATLLTLTGTDFTKVSAVLFGTTKGTSLSVSSSTKLTVRTPRHANGWADVTVVTKYGTSPVVEAGRYLFGVEFDTTNLRVGSFNIRNANSSQNSSDAREKPWTQRRPVVVDQVIREGIDVLGVQEASAGDIPGGDDAQFQDLANALGEPYALTNTTRYCDELGDTDGDDSEVDAAAYTPGECINGAGQSDRIIYNSDRLEMLRQGSVSLDDRTDRDGAARHMTWAAFHDNSTGKEFLFASVHLQPKSDKHGTLTPEELAAVHKVQAAGVLDELAAANPADENGTKLPVVLVGDFGMTKFSTVGNTAHDIFVDEGGFADPLGNTYKQKSTEQAFARELVDVQYSSLNYFAAKPQVLSGYEIGSYIDYILLSGRDIQALEWKTVVDLDSAGAFTGVIPSDHNLVKLTIELP